MNGDQAKDLMQMEIWTELVREIDALITFEEKKLRGCKPEDLSGIQGKIMVYESVKALPQNIIDREEE